MPALFLAGAAWAQPVDRPVNNITPYDARSVMAPALPAPGIGHHACVAARAPGAARAHYVWVPPEATPRRVQSAELVPGAYVWRNGAYVCVPTHYAN